MTESAKPSGGDRAIGKRLTALGAFKSPATRRREKAEQGGATLRELHKELRQPLEEAGWSSGKIHQYFTALGLSRRGKKLSDDHARLLAEARPITDAYDAIHRERGIKERQRIEKEASEILEKGAFHDYLHGRKNTIVYAGSPYSRLDFEKDLRDAALEAFKFRGSLGDAMAAYDRIKKTGWGGSNILHNAEEREAFRRAIEKDLRALGRLESAQTEKSTVETAAQISRETAPTATAPASATPDSTPPVLPPGAPHTPQADPDAPQVAHGPVGLQGGIHIHTHPFGAMPGQPNVVPGQGGYWQWIPQSSQQGPQMSQGPQQMTQGVDNKEAHRNRYWALDHEIGSKTQELKNVQNVERARQIGHEIDALRQQQRGVANEIFAELDRRILADRAAGIAPQTRAIDQQLNQLGQNPNSVHIKKGFEIFEAKEGRIKRNFMRLAWVGAGILATAAVTTMPATLPYLLSWAPGWGIATKIAAVTGLGVKTVGLAGAGAVTGAGVFGLGSMPRSLRRIQRASKALREVYGAAVNIEGRLGKFGKMTAFASTIGAILGGTMVATGTDQVIDNLLSAIHFGENGPDTAVSNQALAATALGASAVAGTAGIAARATKREAARRIEALQPVAVADVWRNARLTAEQKMMLEQFVRDVARGETDIRKIARDETMNAQLLQKISQSGMRQPQMKAAMEPLRKLREASPLTTP